MVGDSVATLAARRAGVRGHHLLQIPARLIRTSRQWTLRMPARWPWQSDFSTVLDAIRALPARTSSPASATTNTSRPHRRPAREPLPENTRRGAPARRRHNDHRETSHQPPVTPPRPGQSRETHSPTHPLSNSVSSGLGRDDVDVDPILTPKRQKLLTQVEIRACGEWRRRNSLPEEWPTGPARCWCPVHEERSSTWAFVLGH